MAASMWPDVVAAIVTGMRAKTGYRSPTDSADGTTVFRGTEVGASEDAGNWLTIGWAGDPDQPTPAGTIGLTTSRHTPARPRDESSTITCRAVWQTGDVAEDAATDGALGIAADLEDFLRTDPKVGIAATTGRQLLWCLVEEVEIVSYLTAGTVGEAHITVRYIARV